MPRKPTGRPRGRPRKSSPFASGTQNAQFPIELSAAQNRALAAEVRCFHLQIQRWKAAGKPPTNPWVPDGRRWPVDAAAAAIAAEAGISERWVQTLRRRDDYLIAFVSRCVEAKREARPKTKITIHSGETKAMTDWLRNNWPRSGVWKIGRREFSTPEELARHLAGKKMVPYELVRFSGKKGVTSR